jgi:5-methylcytosine-specific restriction endonuclease McrA
VEGADVAPAGALEALSRAFQRYGGKCFYCPTRFEPQPFSPTTAHRDHVIAASAGGSDLLHNLVIACHRCDTEKGSDTVQDFRPKAAKAYLAALEKHIARCVRAPQADF